MAEIVQFFERKIMVPSDPGFYQILHNPHLSSQKAAFWLVRADTGLLEPATLEEVNEYLQGGEYSEVVGE